MTDAVDVLLVGGGVAAARCARSLRRAGFDGSILLVGTEDRLPYNRPPLSKELLRDDVPDELLLAEPASWYERRRVAVRTGTTVEALDLDRRRATLSDGSDVGFERVLLATGAEPIVPPLPGIERALPLRTADDARRIRAAALRAGPGARAAVIGGGFIGVEVASGLASLGLEPTIIERGPELWNGSLGTTIGAWARRRLAGQGVEVRLGTTVTAVETGSIATDHGTVATELVVVGVGVRPRDGLARAAGAEVDDGIVVDGAGHTSHPAAWAAGDVARVAGTRVEHWHAAREAGERAARSMLGLDPGTVPVPWVFSEVDGEAIDVFGVVPPETGERSLAGGTVVGWFVDDRAQALAVIGGAIGPDVARGLVADGASVSEVEGSAAGTP